MVTAPIAKVYLDRPNRSPKMLKVVKVLLHNQDRALETYAVLDHVSEQSIILPQGVQRLNLTAQPETLTLQTVHQDVVQLHGASVAFAAAVQATTRAECGSHRCTTSQHSPHQANRTHQEDHSLVRLYYSSTLDQVGILSLKSLCRYTCCRDTEPYGGE